MCGVNTEMSTTKMVNTKPIGNRSDMQSVRECMGRCHFAIKPELPISIWACRSIFPEPTGTQIGPIKRKRTILIHFEPETKDSRPTPMSFDTAMWLAPNVASFCIALTSHIGLSTTATVTIAVRDFTRRVIRGIMGLHRGTSCIGFLGVVPPGVISTAGAFACLNYSTLSVGWQAC